MNQRKAFNIIAKVYDLYGPMLYGIALEITGSKTIAEEIIYTTFQKFQNQNLLQENKHFHCAILIKLMIKTAHEQLKNGSDIINFKVKQFEEAPLLHKLLCELVPLEDHCVNNNLTRAEAAKQFRAEFNLIFRKN